jgi:hypothetical protein
LTHGKAFARFLLGVCVALKHCAVKIWISVSRFRHSRFLLESYYSRALILCQVCQWRKIESTLFVGRNWLIKHLTKI